MHPTRQFAPPGENDVVPRILAIFKRDLKLAQRGEERRRDFKGVPINLCRENRLPRVTTKLRTLLSTV